MSDFGCRPNRLDFDDDDGNDDSDYSGPTVLRRVFYCLWGDVIPFYAANHFYFYLEKKGQKSFRLILALHSFRLFFFNLQAVKY